jgi:hypothetical protein
MNSMLRTLTWSAAVSIPLSFFIKEYGYMLVHGSIGFLFVMAPAYVVLERSGELPAPTIGVSLIYYLIQLAYYAAIFLFFKWRISSQSQ